MFQSGKVELLISAFAEIADRFPNWDIHFWGDGNDKYKSELIKQIKENHLENRVFLCGTTHDVTSQYMKADIFAFPSSYEGFPLALTEAMSIGLPIVAYKSCRACADIIQNGKTGLLADDGVEAFAQKLATMMEDQNLRITLGHNAREAMKEFSPEKIWNKWENILTSIISGRPVD